MQLALYFQRVAPSVTSAYGILGDKNLLQAFQTIYGVTLNSNGNIDANAAIVDRTMPIKDLQDPAKLKQLTARFTAQYTLLYGPGGQNASTPLTVTSGGQATTHLNAATSIMSGIVSGNTQLQRLADRLAAVERAAQRVAAPDARRLNRGKSHTRVARFARPIPARNWPRRIGRL